MRQLIVIRISQGQTPAHPSTFALHPSFAGRFLHDFQRIGFVSHITECYGYNFRCSLDKWLKKASSSISFESDNLTSFIVFSTHRPLSSVFG